jgi:hypothetical protein
MKRIIKEWFFINYCTQVVGMWDKSDLINGTNHIIKIQITNLLIPVIFITYAYFDGPSGIYVFLCVIPFILLIYQINI